MYPLIALSFSYEINQYAKFNEKFAYFLFKPRKKVKKKTITYRLNASGPFIT